MPALLAFLALALIPGDILGIPLLLVAFLARFLFPVEILALTYGYTIHNGALPPPPDRDLEARLAPR